jgi:signal transduction histidine kinase/CheY-like chemotaxis protein
MKPLILSFDKYQVDIIVGLVGSSIYSILVSIIFAIVIPNLLLTLNNYKLLFYSSLLIMFTSDFGSRISWVTHNEKALTYDVIWSIGLFTICSATIFFDNEDDNLIENDNFLDDTNIAVRTVVPLGIIIFVPPVLTIFSYARIASNYDLYNVPDSALIVCVLYIISNIVSNFFATETESMVNSIIIPRLTSESQITDENNLKFFKINIKKFVLKEYKSLAKKFNEQSDEANKLVDVLVSQTKIAAVAKMTQMLAHDVRKPFTMLETAIDMISRANSPNEIYKISRALVPQVRRSISLVNGLIQDVMEIGATSNQIELEPVNPDSLLEITLREIFQVFPNSEIKLSYNLQHTYMINANIQKVGRVFSNIITNSIEALKYKGNIWFKTRDVVDVIEFCIGNSGSFISKESIPKLFDAFFTVGKKEGTGLGLAIAQKVIAAHGGKIWCESSKTHEFPDGKVEFFFTLPIAENYPLKIELHLPTHSSEIINNILEFSKNENKFLDVFITNNEAELENEIYEACKKLGRAINILIVDDESIYRIALIESLSKISKSYITLSQANDSLNALSLLDKMSFDLIITDIDMGSESLDGFELVQELRKFRQVESLICIHSNCLITVDQNTVLDSGIDAFIPKPIARGQLLKLILRSAEKCIELEKINTNFPLTIQDSNNNSNLIISIIDDEKIILNNWRFYLGEKNVFYFEHPDDFILAYSDDISVKKTNLVITDYYFNNSPVTKLLDIKMLKHVMKFKGKIFLFSNIGNIDLKSSFFDYILSEKTSYYNKKQLENILDRI